MSFFDDQEDDWLANDCKGSPDDYYAGELAPWRDGFTDTIANVHRALPDPKRSASKKRRDRHKRAELRKKQESQEKP
jgi:hypothetical protein